MRTAPTVADRELMAALENEGLHASHAQLERWRQHGLLPRTRLDRAGWGGSKAAMHPEYVLEAARVLAEASSRGRPWQYLGIYLFEEGLPLPTATLQQCATWLINTMQRRWLRPWREAQTLVAADPEDPLGELTDVAFTAAELGSHYRRTAGLAKVVRENIRSANPHLTESQLAEATERSVGWRLADMIRPDLLGERERTLARSGTDEPMDPARWRFATPSEAKGCAATMTAAEAYVMRRYVLALDAAGVMSTSDRFLLDLVTWAVAETRLNDDANAARDVSRTVSQSELEDMHAMTRELLDDIEGGVHPGQL